MNTAKRVIKNTGFLYAKMGITLFASLYTTRIVLKTLGASDFGIFNVVGGAIAMMGFFNASLASATQRFMSYAEGEGNEDKQKSIFNISFILHFFMAFFIAIILFIVGYFFFNGILDIKPERLFAAKIIYGSLIISTILTVMTVPYDAILNAHENMLYFAFVGIIESILKLFIALLIVNIEGDKLIMYGVLMAIIPVITIVIMRIYCHKNYAECQISPKKYWDKGLMRQMGSFAGWNLIGSASSIVSTYGVGIIMNSFHGTVANAAQGIANQISGQLGVLGSSIKKSLTPVISKSAGAGDHALMIKSTILGTKIILFVVTFMFIPFMVEMPFILDLWLVNPPKNTEIFCWLLLLTNFINDLTLFLPQAISAVGKIKHFQLANSIILLLPICISYVAFTYGAPPYIIYLVTAIIGMGQNFVIMYYAEKVCDISLKMYFLNVVVRCVIAFGSVLVLGYLLITFIEEGFFRLFVTFIFTTLLYGFVFYLIGLNNEEKESIKKFLKPIALRYKIIKS